MRKRHTSIWRKKATASPPSRNWSNTFETGGQMTSFPHYSAAAENWTPDCRNDSSHPTTTEATVCIDSITTDPVAAQANVQRVTCNAERRLAVCQQR